MIRLIIIFSFIGYSHVVLAFSDPAKMVAEQEIKVLLGMSLEELMNVEVKTASKVSEKIGEIPASVVLITRKEIETYGYSRLEELLEHVSGMYKIDTYGGHGPNYGVRGFWNMELNRNIIILINGIRQISDFEANYGIEFLPPIEAVDRIEVIRGPMSVIYGTGAFFGVINIITNQIEEEDTNYHMAVGLGSQQTHQLFMRLQHAYEEGQVVLNAVGYDADGINYPYSNMTSQLRMPSILGKSTEGKLTNQQKQVNLSANYQDLSLDIAYINSSKDKSVILPATAKGHSGPTKTTYIQAGYQKALTDQFSIEAKLGYTNQDSDIYLDLDIMVPNSGGQMLQHSRAYNAELNSIWQAGNQLDIVSGVQYRRVTGLMNYVNIPFIYNGLQEKGLVAGNDLVNWGVFTQLSYRPNEQWKWIGGVRLEKTLGYTGYNQVGTSETLHSIESTPTSIIPRFAAIYTPNSLHTFKFLYGVAENSPSFSQHFASLNGKQALEPEKIQTVELDYLTYLSPQYLFSVNLFKNSLQNLLVRKSELAQDNVFYTYMSNSSHWDTKGIEVSLQAQPTEAWELELSATYQTTKDRDNPDIAIAYSPHWLGQMKLAYHANSQLQFGLTGYYVAKMDSYFDPTKTGTDNNLGARIGQASDAYTVMSGNLRFSDWFAKGTFMDLHIYNLFDQEIRYPTTLENTWADKGLLGYERSFMLSLGYQF